MFCHQSKGVITDTLILDEEGIYGKMRSHITI
jgi:hypothetical protein